MPLVLRERASHLTEALDGPLDDPACDPRLVERSYRQFRWVNALLSRTPLIYRRYLRPLMTDRERRYSLLDIGFGGGDIARRLVCYAEKDGLDLRVTGIEIDPRAYAYVQRFPQHPRLSFRLADVATLQTSGERFDFVISNHVVHHLDGPGLQAMLKTAAALARHRVVFNDIRRSDLAYLGFWLLTVIAFHRSYIRDDGLISVKRSYTAQELGALLPAGWELRRAMPFRLLLIHPGTR